jgi:phage-related minor tail protein
MATRTSYMIRFGAEGVERVTSEVLKVEQALNRSGQAAEAAGTKAERAAARQQAAYLRTAEAAARADPNRRQQVIDMVVGVGANAGRAERSAQVFEAQMLADERAAQALRAAIDPLAAAQDRYNDELIELNGLYTRGAITQQQFLQGQTLLRRQLDESTAALGRNTNGLTRNQLASRLNLTRQGADVLVTGAMGMNPAMIALQQGPQILDALATSGLRASAGMIALGAAVGTAAASVGVLAAGWVTGERDALALERAVNGLGRTSGLTRAELERLTDAAAENGRVSVASAREQAVAYLNTGRIGRENIQGLIEIGRDYASVMGMDAEQATQSLAQAMLNPSKAARELGVQFGALSVEQIKQIDNLVKSGQLFQAQAALIDGLRSSIDGHADDVGKITSAWDAASRAVSNFWTNLGEALWEDDQERLNRLNREIDRIRSGANAMSPSGGQDGRRLSSLIAQRDALQATLEASRAAAARQTEQARTNQTAVQAFVAGERRQGSDGEGRREAEERRAEMARRRSEDAVAALELEIAQLANDQDRVRVLQIEARQRERIRTLIDDGVTADEARTVAQRETMRLVLGQVAATARGIDDIERGVAVEVASLTNARARGRLLEDEEQLRQRVQRYVELKLDLEEATTRAMKDQASLQGARAAAMEREVEAARRSREIELLRLEGRSDQDPTLRGRTREDAIQRRAREIEGLHGLDFGQGVAEATRQIDEDLQATARGALRGGLRGFIDDIRRGDIGDALGNQFERASDRAIDRLLDAIISTDWGSLFNGGGGGKGGGGWISAGLNVLFGRNAVGTEFWRGGPTWVGENGKELVDLPRGARVIPAHRAGAMASAPTVIHQHNYNLQGAHMTRDLMELIRSEVAQGKAEIRSEVPALAVGAVAQARQRRVIG